MFFIITYTIGWVALLVGIIEYRYVNNSIKWRYVMLLGCIFIAISGIKF